MKVLGRFFLMFLLVSVLALVGCFGGGDDDNGYTAATGAIKVSATADAGAGNTFAAAMRGAVSGDLRAAVSEKYQARVKIGGGRPRSFPVEHGGQTLKLDAVVDGVSTGKQQVTIEIVAKGAPETADPILKTIETATVAAGQTNENEIKDVPVTVETTVKAIVLESMSNNSAAGVDDMVITSDISALQTKLQTAIASQLTNPTSDFSLAAVDPTIKSGAADVAQTTTIPVPEPVTSQGTPIPATRIVDLDVTLPNSQVEIAVSESLKTLVDGFRVSERASLKASAVPAGVPGMGSNEAVNINWLMGNLLAALPTGGNINNGVFVDVTDPNSQKYSVATFTASTNTLEVADVSYYYNNNGVMTKYLKKTMKITGCAATVNNGTLTQLSIQAGSIIEMKEYERDGSLSGTVTIKLVSGAKIEMTSSLNPDTGFIVLNTAGNWSFGLIKSLSGTESMKVTFDGSSAAFDVTISDSESGNLTTGTLAISSLSGIYTVTSPIAIGMPAFKSGPADPVVENGACERKEWLSGETQTNELVFANDTFKFAFNVNYNRGDVTLENGMIELKNVNKQTPKAGETDANYSFSDGTASMMVKYNGTNYAQYGYIYSLQFAISKMSFDPANPTAAGEGTQVIVTKTNSDKTVDTLTYAIKNQMPVLQTGSDSRFAGGTEKVTEVNGETIVEGSVIAARSADATAAKLQVNYRSVKNARGEISTRAVVKQATTTRTMFFTRQTTRVIGGHVYEGELTSETGTPAGNFSAANGTGSLNFGGATTQFRVQN